MQLSLPSLISRGLAMYKNLNSLTLLAHQKRISSFSSPSFSKCPKMRQGYLKDFYSLFWI
ncbi:MAG: hypothetical protein D6805_00060 [Planctomycetota bacterium]|nr:MAG: hypothetical protein D6805_00060 [Planctomycetota bacterium]